MRPAYPASFCFDISHLHIRSKKYPLPLSGLVPRFRIVD
jgi:hypothetical protein